MSAPIENTIYKGTISPKTPYITAEKALPQVVAAEKNPRIAPRFPSGKANIIDALKIVLPAVLQKPPRNANTHIGKN